MEMVDVCCPTCGECFTLREPAGEEMPCRLDYDCEICCRPMIIVFTAEEVYAKGWGIE